MTNNTLALTSDFVNNNSFRHIYNLYIDLKKRVGNICSPLEKNISNSYYHVLAFSLEVNYHQN